MLRTTLLVTLGSATALRTSPAAGFGKQSSSAAAAAPSHASPSIFRWAEGQGVECGGPLSVRDFDGIRGVATEVELAPGTRVLAVPSSLALQVTTEQPAPKWADKEAWASSKWYTRLALRLLHEKKQGAASELQPWVEQLPDSFDTPFFWSDGQLEALGYRPLQEAVENQRTEWAAAARLLAQKGGSAAPSDDELFWALSCVRSRAFSGPWSGGSIKSSGQQLAFAVLLATVWVVGGLGPADAAANGVLAVLAFILANDLIFGPRFSRARRYVVCPVVDFCNHHSSQAGVEVSYEYFADAFGVVLQRGVAAGGEVRISYGARASDQLLQWYGFVEADNPHDAFELRQDELIVALAAAAPYAPANVQALRGAQLTDNAATLTFGRGGVDARALRVARLLLHPQAAAAAAGEEGALKLADEVATLRAVAAVAEAQAAALGDLQAEQALLLGPTDGEGSAAAATRLARQFRVEKIKVLLACAAATRARADGSEKAGRLLPAPSDDAEAASATGGRPSLPGLGLSRVRD